METPYGGDDLARLLAAARYSAAVYAEIYIFIFRNINAFDGRNGEMYGISCGT